MTLITVEDLKTQLTLEGVSYDDFDDSQLELLLNNIKNEIAGYTNAPITPTDHKMIIRGFDDDMVELDYYPVTCISNCKVGSTTLQEKDYFLDETLGILYFNAALTGLLIVEYTCCVSDKVLTEVVNPLMFDMIKYRLGTGFSPNGVLSSVKEGDVSVNYDTGSSLGALILGRINDLKHTYSIRVKVL